MLKLIIKLSFLFPVISLIFFSGCAEDPVPSLWQEEPSGLKPVVSSIGPAEALAGVTLLTIDGSNFSSTPEHNLVTFNGTAGQIVSASPNQLIVKAPLVVDDTVYVLVSVVDAVSISDSVAYNLRPAIVEIKKDAEGSDLFSADLVPYGLTTDADGNLYVSVAEFNQSVGIKKIMPSGLHAPFGTLNDFAPGGGTGGTYFHKINMYENNTILGARRTFAIMEVTEGTASKLFVAFTSSQLIFDLDYDANLNIWAVGRGIHRVTPAKEKKSFDYPVDINAVRYFNNYLYIIASSADGDVIRRIPVISNDSIDINNAEDVFNISEAVLPDSGTTKIRATDLDIAADGDIILGTTKETEPVIVVHPDGTYEPLYQEVISGGTRVFSFAWAPGNFLYFTREASGSLGQVIMRLDMQKPGAPYYGR